MSRCAISLKQRLAGALAPAGPGLGADDLWCRKNRPINSFGSGRSARDREAPVVLAVVDQTLDPLDVAFSLAVHSRAPSQQSTNGVAELLPALMQPAAQGARWNVEESRSGLRVVTLRSRRAPWLHEVDRAARAPLAESRRSTRAVPVRRPVAGSESDRSSTGSSTS